MSRRVVSGIISTLLIINMLMFRPAFQSTSSDTTVQFSPRITRLKIIETTFEVNITVTNVTDLFGFFVSLSWDPRIIRVTMGDPNGYTYKDWKLYGIYEGPFMTSVRETLFLVKRLSNEKGEIELGIWYPDVGPTATGSGVLVTFNFTVVGAGASILNITGISSEYPGHSLLVNSQNKEIPHEDIDGMVEVFTICVDDDNTLGPWDGSLKNPYQNITSALQHALTDDLIFVRNGIYHENLVVDKTVSLVGEDRINTIIDGNENGDVITATASNATISSFTIRKSRPYSSCSGILLLSSLYTTIENNIITTNAWGIQLEYSHSNMINNNHIVNSTDMDGIYLYHSESNLIRDNHIANNRIGIFLFESSKNTIANNEITDNRYLGAQIFGLESNQTLIVNNTISNNGIDPTRCDGIAVDLSSNNRIINNTVGTNARDGIHLSRSNDNIIQGNKILNNEGRAGILLSSWDGLYSTNNAITANYIAENEYGIYLDYSTSNTISANHIEENENGIYIIGSSGNLIYQNNFFNNTRQALCENETAVNAWDNGYPSGGNYWSDYNGTDLYSGPYQNVTGRDGIGDSQGIINENNIDRYPLVAPSNLLSIAWNEVDYIVGFVSHSSISDLHFYGAKRLLSFNITGQDETAGFCRVTIPKSLMEPSMSEKWLTLIDLGLPLSTSIMQDEDCTHICFTYKNSTHRAVIQIITEKETIVRLYPETVIVRKGETFSVNVIIENMPEDPGMIGVQFKITWDPALLNAVNMTEVLFHSATPPDETSNIWQLQHDVTAGCVQYAYTWMNITRAIEKGYAPISGNHTIATIRINANATGHATLHFSVLIVGSQDAEGSVLALIDMREPFSPYPGTGMLDFCLIESRVEIREKMPGDTNLDGAVDLSDAMTAANAFGSYPEYTSWNSMADENDDGVIDLFDLILVATNFGKEYR